MQEVQLKKELRKEMRVIRDQLDVDLKRQYDHWIRMVLRKLILEKNCKVVHAYLPMGSEIDISPLLKELLSMDVTVIAPKTLPNRKLENLVLHGLDQVEEGVYGTTHPSSGEIYDGPIDFIIIPGLAFDDDNYRLGYGGGYYDNFLMNHPESFKAGIYYPFQKVDNVPLEPHDQSLDIMIYNRHLL